MTVQIIFEGADSAALDIALARSRDHADNPISPFIDDEGGWPLRCCLQNSSRGDLIAIIAWSPFTWHGPYRETGPIVVHVERCSRNSKLTELPADLNGRPMTLRPYGAEHTILYDLVTHVPANGDMTAEATALLAHEAVVEVYAKNATGGCFAFVARRRPWSELQSPEL